MTDQTIQIKCGNPKCGSVLRADTSKINADNPLVKCPRCKSTSRVKLPEAKSTASAWLVRHTENQSPATYELKPGKNTIGRKALDPSYPVPDIQLAKQDDPYVSRGIHCTLEIVEVSGRTDAVIYDNSSTNGTFINDKSYRLKPGDEEYVQDGETIQAGRTKFVLKTRQSAASKSEAQTIVQQTDYAETIIT